jgi:tripartite ATP-independent transporter DctM subunit
MYRALGILLTVLALIGMPLFAVLGGISIISWASDGEPLRRVAANIIDDKFSDSIILVTIPLFVFVGYLMAESKTPQRVVAAAAAVLGWLPGGLAVVCILATAVFTMLTGGSGVAIVAIGGLLYPVLLKQGYEQRFALGLVTTAGAIGLLLPPSPLVLIYCYVTGVDVSKTYKAALWPGLVLIVLLSAYAMVVGIRSRVPTQPFRLADCAREFWRVKWEALAPVLVLTGLGTGLMELHESAAAAALYTVIVEVYIYKDLTWKKVLKVAKDAMSLAGAIIIILALATALTNYVIHAKIPQTLLQWFDDRGMDELWQFIIVLNIFLFIMGMLMDAFSVLLVALPLLVPLAARFGMHPFYLAVMFLLNLELAYVTPPVGLNLYIASFRFRRPVVEIYRVVLPFVGILAAGLLLVIFVPRLSTFTVEDEVAKLRREADEEGVPPTEAWALECIQQDRTNLKPCSDADVRRWGKDGEKRLALPDAAAGEGGSPPNKESVEDLDKAFDDDEEEEKPKDAGADDGDTKDGEGGKGSADKPKDKPKGKDPDDSDFD